MPNSQNGWPAVDSSRVKVWRIPGTERLVTLEKDNAGFLLTDFAAWFHRNIEPIDSPPLDDWGYNPRRIAGTNVWSNHASGTAIDLNAIRHPQGKANTFTRDEQIAIRNRLAWYEGCIRWGGDYRTTVDDMHFEINRDAAAVAAVAKRVWDRMQQEVIQKLDEIIKLLGPIHRACTIELDFRHHHLRPVDDFVGHVLSVRNLLTEVASGTGNARGLNAPAGESDESTGSGG